MGQPDAQGHQLACRQHMKQVGKGIIAEMVPHGQPKPAKPVQQGQFEAHQGGGQGQQGCLGQGGPQSDSTIPPIPQRGRDMPQAKQQGAAHRRRKKENRRSSSR